MRVFLLLLQLLSLSACGGDALFIPAPPVAHMSGDALFISAPSSAHAGHAATLHAADATVPPPR